MGNQGYRFVFLFAVSFLLVITINSFNDVYADHAQVHSFQKITEGVGGFTGDLDTSDSFGPVASIGDLDNDGVNDLVVGAPSDDDTASAAGAVYILFMNSDGTVKSFQKITEGVGGFTGDLDATDYFGSSIAGIGDLDGDGIEDIAVGAPGDDDDASAAGAVWILFLDADGTVDDANTDGTKITQGVGGFTGVLDISDFFGNSVALIGDLDNDGTNDIAVGALGDDDDEAASGAVWILFLDADGTVDDANTDGTKITQGVGDFTGDLTTTDWFGTSVAGIGDLDGDGIEDIAVGAPGDDDGGGGDEGAVWILFLDADGTVDDANTDGTKISDTAGGFTGEIDADDRFGDTVTKIGDQNGDGVDDLVVGADKDDDAAANAGAVWLLLMDTDGTVDDANTDGTKITEGAGGFTGDLDTGDLFGGGLFTLGFLGGGAIAAVDIDGDNIEDLAVGAPGDDDAASAAGAIYILFLGDGPPSASGAYHCSDCSPPSLGIDKNGRKVVDYGFSYNGNPTHVEYTYTSYPLIAVNVGAQQVAELVIFEDRGPEHLSHIALAFGLKEGQVLGESKAVIVWDRNFLGEETITTIDPENVIDKETLEIQTSKTKCLASSQNKFCTKLVIIHMFRAPLDFDIVGVTMWDDRRNSWQNTLNHGIHVQGKSLNPPAEYTLLDKRNLITITEIGKNAALDENGYLWIYDKSWQKQFIPVGKIDDGVTMHLFDRNHLRFDTYKQGQELLAELIMEKICPKCNDKPFNEINNIKISPYTNVKDQPRIDDKMQKNIEREIIKAEKKHNYLYSNLDRMLE